MPMELKEEKKSEKGEEKRSAAVTLDTFQFLFLVHPSKKKENQQNESAETQSDFCKYKLVMGKRKRRADLNKTPPPSDLMPPSPGMDALSKQRFPHQVDSSGMKPFLTIADIIDGPGKVTQGQQSSIVHRRNIDIPKSLRNHRHYGRHYSRRRSTSNAEASTSHGGHTPFYDEKLSLKMASKCYSVSGRDPENRQRAAQKPEGVPSSSLAASVISSDAGKLFCVLCRKFLKNESYIVLDNTLPIGETVAVLACGHLYHADCLEARTNREDRHDPPCPTCLGLVSHVDASVEQD